MIQTNGRDQKIKMVLNLFQHGQIEDNEKLSLLGILTPINPCFEDITLELENHDQAKFDSRLTALLSIHYCLRLLFPRNRSLVYTWISRINHSVDFNYSRPLDKMLESYEGLINTVASLKGKVLR